MGVAYAIFGCFYYMVYGRDALHCDRKGIRSTGRPELSVCKPSIVLVPIVAIVVTLYGVLEDRAAYWTDLIQGFCIILLRTAYSLRFAAVVKKFGSPEDSWTDGFRVGTNNCQPVISRFGRRRSQ